MRVKRFVANTMQEAIAQVKEDFGANAVILHTKRVRRRGVLGWLRRPRVEVIAAAETRSPQREGGAPGGTQPASAVAQESAATSELAKVHEELVSLKRALIGGDRAEGTVAEPVRERLLRQEIYAAFVDELIDFALDRARQEGDLSDQNVRDLVLARLREGVCCADPDQIDGGRRVHCLVGPTGVGKTTTIAKLAANFALLGGRRVALITVDTYRIAAVEQLKVYAEIIGVPIDVAMTPAELKEAVARRSDADLIFVDTAGRSQKHKMQMQEVKAFVEALEDPHVHLVLSAGTRTTDLMEMTDRFMQLPVASLIVTKLDETSSYGALYNVCRVTGRPLSYLTNGQSVPDDIEVATPERVAQLIMGVEL